MVDKLSVYSEIVCNERKYFDGINEYHFFTFGIERGPLCLACASTVGLLNSCGVSMPLLDELFSNPETAFCFLVKSMLNGEVMGTKIHNDTP